MSNNKKVSDRPADPVILKGPNSQNGEVVPLPKTGGGIMLTLKPGELDAPSNHPEPVNGVISPRPKQTVITPFEDGYIFKFAQHPTEPNRFVLFTSEKQPVGVVHGSAIADLICQAVKALFLAHQLQADAAQSEANNAARIGDINGNC